MSNPLIEALRLKLKVSVRFFSQVVHIGIEEKSFRVPLIICISEHSLLFLDCSFTKLLGEVFYAHISKVIEQENTSGDILRFEFSEQRAQGIPKKMTLICGEKKKLLLYLKCSWETDYMWRLSKVGTLRIYNEKIDLKRYKPSQSVQLAKEIYLISPSDCFTAEVNGYGFFINDIFESGKIYGEYKGRYLKINYTLTLRIKEVKIIEHINSDLRTLAESASQKLLPLDEDYALGLNNPYIKRSNFVMDIAKWEGWHTTLVTKSMHISLIILRRKFIPPMVDSGQDIYISVVGGPNSIVFCTDTADSVYTLGIPNEVYTTVLTQKCEALIMNEETMHYYQTKFNIKPSKVFYGYQAIISILSMIDRQVPDQGIKKIIEDIKKNPQSKNPEAVIEKLEDPNRIIEDFCKSSYLDPSSSGYGIWCRKVYRYIAYCIDGGLMQNRITLDDILTNLLKLKFEGKDFSRVRMFLARILNIHERFNFNEFDDIYIGVSKMLESSGFIFEEQLSSSTMQAHKNYTPYKSWMFNYKVMASLIETGFMKKELELNNLNSLFPKLLIYLLQRKSTPLFLKSTVCRITININESTDLVTLKVLLPHLFDIYTSKNNTLAAQAAISLVNLTYNNKENKQFIYNYREDVINRLLSKDHKILAYTILLLINLSSDQTRKKIISKESREHITKILRGNSFNKHNPEVVTKALQILTIFARDHSNADYFSSDEEFISTCLKLLAYSEETDLRIVGFLEVLCERNQSSKSIIGQKCIVPIVNNIKTCQNLEIIKKSLSLLRLITINKGDENYLKLQSCNIIKVLDGLLQNRTLTMDDNLVKQINLLHDFLM